MRLGKGSYKNFGSYPSLEFDFSHQDLTLISGPTGSGKSTFMDAPAWCLYGQTSKNGSVDEIKSWDSEEETTGTQEVFLADGTSILVTRIRGTAKTNDLFWCEQEAKSNPIRGKDLTETQSLLEARLGVTAELYFMAAYFSQFSQADSFFVAKAKERREVLENIADLSLPVKIGEAAASHRKIAKNDCDAKDLSLARIAGRLAVLREGYNRSLSAVKTWEPEQKKRIQALQDKEDSFEMDKQAKINPLVAKIEQLMTEVKPKKEFDFQISQVNEMIMSLSGVKCKTCGGRTDSPEREKFVKELAALDKARLTNTYKERELAQLKKELEEVYDSKSPYADQIAEAKNEVNPHAAQTKEIKNQITNAVAEEGAIKLVLAAQQHRLSALNQLYDLSMELRAKLLQAAVINIETATNAILESCFDGEIKIEFTLSSDKLEVEIQKNGHICSFRSLSGGQRCMLKLAFTTSLMQAASDKAGQHFDNIFLDEPLSGLDNNLKLKAFSLFETLEKKHSSIFVIEHAGEFKNLFANTYQVTIAGDRSEIEQANG